MAHSPFPDPTRALRQVWRHHRRDGVLPGATGARVQEHTAFGRHPDLITLDHHLDHVYREARDEQ